jgi:hypothetical protein
LAIKAIFLFKAFPICYGIPYETGICP